MKSIKELVPEFYTIDEAIQLSGAKTRELQLTHLNEQRTLLGHAKYFTYAKDSTFIDDSGNKHLDMIGGVGVVSVGNNNDFVWECIKKCFESSQYMMGAVSYHNVTAAFAHNLALLSPGKKLTKVWTATGGAEAIEGVIKLVRLATRNKPHKTHVLSTKNSFHGKTSGAVSLGGKDKWRMYQELDLQNITHINYASLEELETELKKGIYQAFIVEPIQGEGGIIVPPEGYLKKARELCTQYDTYLVLDEIQCGAGRTGKLWCCEYEEIIPDCIVFAKGFSGGLIPFGGYNCTKELYEAAYGDPETCFHHTATYQDNTISAAAGLGALQFILEHNLFEAAKEKGDYLIAELRKIQQDYPEIIKEVRGKGLMVGIEFNRLPEEKRNEFGEFYSGLIFEKLVDENRVQAIYTINNDAVFRFLPPLIITFDELDIAIRAMRDSVEKIVTMVA